MSKSKQRRMYSHGEVEQQREMTGPGNSQSLHHTQNTPEKQAHTRVSECSYSWATAAREDLEHRNLEDATPPALWHFDGQ